MLSSQKYAANNAAVRIEDSSTGMVIQSEEAVHRELGCVVHHTRRHFGSPCIDCSFLPSDSDDGRRPRAVLALPRPSPHGRGSHHMPSARRRSLDEAWWLVARVVFRLVHGSDAATWPPRSLCGPRVPAVIGALEPRFQRVPIVCTRHSRVKYCSINVSTLDLPGP